MADRQGRIEIDATIDASLQAALQGMSASLRNVLDVTNSFAKAGVNNVNTAQALTKALTNATSASSLYSRASDGLARNQAVLGKYFRDTSVAASQLEKQLKSNTNATQAERDAVNQLISSLKAQSNARKEIMKYSAQADLRRQSDALNQLSSRYSMAGTRMSMALTLPIASFMRSSFANYRRLETETIRTTKLISDSYTRAADVAGIAGAKLAKDQLSYTREVNGTIRTLLTLEGAQKRLGEELDQVSTKYGIARELVQGLAGDFAELGIEEVDVLAGLVDLTAGVEKLGNLDIGASQEFIKSIFQTILRIKRDTGTLERTAEGFIDYSNAVAETTQQLALFNLIENKTQMSLKDVAKGFPEVTAAATSFGLTMTEATALVVPMVSAGMQVGASANSVKVSLQRVVDLTKENSTMIKTLKDNYKDFNVEAGVGVETVQALADSYNSMKRGALAEQGTLEFFSRLFGVRQGPRMEVAIQNLAQFQENLTKGLQALDKDDTSAETIEGILARKLEQAVQQQAKAQGLGQQFTSFTVKKFEDLGKVVRLSQSKDAQTAKAFSNARNELAEYVKDEAKKGNDVLSKVATESGKALFIGAIGNVEGQRKFQQEVEASLKSVEVRYQRARELIKSIGRQLVPVLAEILSAVLPVLQKINDIFTKIPSWVKYVVSFGLIMLATIGPILKLAGSLFQLRSAMFSLKAAGGIFGRLKPQGNEISAELVAASDAAFRFKNVLTEVGGKFFLKGTKKEIRDLNRLMRLEMQGASPDKIAALEKKLKLKTTADMSGVSMSTIQAKQATGFDSFMGYAKQLFEDPAIPAAIMTYTAAVEKLGETITATLRVIGESFGFDPASIVAPPKPAPTSGGTTTSTGLPRKGGKGGSGGTPPSGGGTSPSGGTPSGGTPSGGTSPGGSGATAVTPSTTPATPAPTTVKLDRDIVAEPDPVVEQALTAYEQALADLKGATKKQLIELAKQLGIEKISGLSLKSNLLKIGQLKDAIAKAQTAVKEKVEEAVEAVAEDTKEKAKSVKTKAPPGKGKKSKKVEEASDAVTDVVAEAQAEKDAVVVTEQGKDDATATKKKTGKKATKASKKVEDSSEKGAEIVAEVQAEVDVDAVEEQVKVDVTAVKESTTKTTKKGTRKLKDAVTKVVEAAEDTIEQSAEDIISDSELKRRYDPRQSPLNLSNEEVRRRTRQPQRPIFTVGASLPEDFATVTIPESNFIRLDIARQLSTLQQLIQNALNASGIEQAIEQQIISIKDVVEAAGIVVTETKAKGPRYEITREAFLNLAKVLGIQLPPAFEKMGELVGRNGKSLQIYQQSLEDLIYSLISTVDFSLDKAAAEGIDPEHLMVLQQFPELINAKILEFEYDLLRAFATGRAGLFNFNLPFSTRESGEGFTGRVRKALEPVMRVSRKATEEQRAEASKRTASEEVLEEDRLTKEREAEIRREKAAKARAERAAAADRKKRKQESEQRKAEESRVAPGQTPEEKAAADQYTRSVVSQGQTKPRSYGVLFNLKDQIDKAIKPRDQVIKEFIRAFREKIGQVRELKLSPQELQKRIDEIVQQAKESAKGVRLPKGALDIPEVTPVKARKATGTGNPVRDVEIIATTVDKVETKVSKKVQDAANKLTQTKDDLRQLEGTVTDVRMAQNKNEPKFAKNAVERLRTAAEQFGIDILDLLNNVGENESEIITAIQNRIEEARLAVQKAEEAVAKAAAPAKSGGGGTGTTTMGLPSMAMTDPFGMPIGPRGPKAPRIGPMSIAFVDKGDIPGGVDSVYSLIRQRLNIPVEVMQEVINQLRNGYTNAEGEVRKAQAKVDEVGVKLSTQVGSGLDELIVTLSQAIGGATDSVEIVRQAIINARNDFYALATKAAKESEKTDRKQLGFGISRDERLKLAEQVANKIREEKSAFDNFLEYQADTLRYIARQFGFTGSGTAAEMRNFLLGRFSSDELGYKILGATEESINAAIEASKEATDKVKKKAETSKKKAEKKAEEDVEEKPKRAPRKKKEPFVYPSTLQIIQAMKPTMPERFVPEPVVPEKPKKASVRLPKGYTKAYMEQLMAIVKPSFEATVEDFASMTKQDLLANLGVFKAIEKDTKAFNYIFEKYGIDIRELINKTVGEIRSRRPVAPDISSIIPKSILNTDIYKEFMSIGIPLQALEDEFQYMQKIIKLSINDLAKESEQSLTEMYNTFTVLKGDTNLVGILLKDMGIDIAMVMEDLAMAIDRINEDKKYAAMVAATASTTATTAATGGGKPPVSAPTATATATTATATATATATRNLNIFSGSLNLLSNGLKKTGSVALFALQPYIYASKTLVPALFNLYTATLKATLGFIPFGRSIYAVVAPIVSIPKVLLNAAKTAKQANSGFKGFVKELKTVLSNGADSLKTVKEKFGKIFSAPAGAIGGLGKNLKSGVMSNIGMSAGMLGTSPLGMFGGNMLQSLITSLSAIPIIGMPVVLTLTAITGAIAVLVKTQKTWGAKSQQTSDNFKKAFAEIKAAGLALLKPLEDLFGVLTGSSDESGTATDKAKNKFEKFSSFVLGASKAIRKFVENTLAPAFRILLSVILVLLRKLAPVAGSAFNLLKALYNQYTEQVQKQKDRLAKFFEEPYTKGSAAAFRFAEENTKYIQSVSSAWSDFKTKFGAFSSAFGVLVSGFVGNLVIDVFKMVTKIFVDATEQIFIGINNLVRWTTKGIVGAVIFGMKYLVSGAIGALETLSGLVSWIPGIGDSISKGLAKGKAASNSFFDNLANKGMGAIGSLIDPSFDALNASIGSWSDETDKAFDKMKEKNRKKFAAQAKEMIKGVLPEGAGSGLFKSFSNLLKQAFKDPAAAKAAGEAIKEAAKKQADAVKDINSKFFDKAVSQLEKAMGKMTSQLTGYLNKQKEDALKAFDDQIAGIEALAEAEERLTATEEYESNRRQRIRDRELQRNNYQKERALAIYEGRIDDARNLDLEELKNFEDYTKEISDMDKARQKDLQSQNRQDAITVIRNQKDAASKLFDEAIKEFEDYIEEQLRNGTTSEEEFKAQFERIAAKAQTTSTSMSSSLSKFFTDLPTQISNGLSPVTSDAGFFSTGMDALVNIAKNKFGIDTQTGASAGSILGVTTAMLSGPSGMSSIISGAFAADGVIRTAYGTGIDSLNTYVKEKLDPTSPNSLGSVFKEAMKKANEDFIAEIERGKTGAGSKIEALAKHLNEKFKAIALKDIMKDAIAQAKKEIENAVNDATGGTGGSGTAGRTQKYSYWYRIKKSGPEGWRGISETSVDRFIGDSRYDVTSTPVGTKPSFFKGGKMSYGMGGPTFGPMNQAIPAILHGGEFVLRKTAVEKYGLEMLNQMNNGIYVPKVPKFNMPMANYAKISGAGSSTQMSSSETTHNYNFFVDNFIGETEWFNSMMKEYNMKVVPANQKQAGLENRVIRTYNGLNRGM